MKWTPLEMQILLHYYYSPEDYRQGDYSAPAVRQAINSFRDELGLIREKSERDGYGLYEITERGRVLVDAALETPLPVQVWVIPKADEVTA